MRCRDSGNERRLAPLGREYGAHPFAEALNVHRANVASFRQVQVVGVYEMEVARRIQEVRLVARDRRARLVGPGHLGTHFGRHRALYQRAIVVLVFLGKLDKLTVRLEDVVYFALFDEVFRGGRAAFCALHPVPGLLMPGNFLADVGDAMHAAP